MAYDEISFNVITCEKWEDVVSSMWFNILVSGRCSLSKEGGVLVQEVESGMAKEWR